MCRQYRDARLKQPHPKTGKLPSLGTITRELAVLRAAVIWCEHNKKLIKGQAPYVEVPGKQPGKDRWLTRSEAARLLWASRHDPKAQLHLPLYVMLGLYTGARRGAIQSLKWIQVDLVRGTIDFNEPGRPVSNKRCAKIQIPAPLKLALVRAQQRTTSPYVISYYGKPITGKINHGFNTACTRAGLKDVTPHTLRNTCGTWLAQAGCPIFEIAGWLGHSIAETTELYAHHHPDHLASARTALDRHHRERTGNQP
jgi:integrase